MRRAVFNLCAIFWAGEKCQPKCGLDTFSKHGQNALIGVQFFLRNCSRALWNVSWAFRGAKIDALLGTRPATNIHGGGHRDWKLTKHSAPVRSSSLVSKKLSCKICAPSCKTNQASSVFNSRWPIFFTNLKQKRPYLLAFSEKAHQTFDDFEKSFPEK